MTPVARARLRVRERTDRLRARYPGFDHLFRAGARYTAQRGDHFAAAVTFYSIVTAVPLLMIGFAAAGYVLAFDPALLADLERTVTEAVPPGLGDTVELVIARALEQRATVAGLGLLGAGYTGIWWVSNLREAVSAQWALTPDASVPRLLLDLLALVGLGAGLIGSFAVSVAVTGIGGRPAELLLGAVVNGAVVLWTVAGLPRVRPPRRVAVQVAVLGAVGFELIELGTTVYLRVVTDTVSGAVFGSLLGLLLFGYTIVQYVLFVAAWAATAETP